MHVLLIIINLIINYFFIIIIIIITYHYYYYIIIKNNLTRNIPHTTRTKPFGMWRVGGTIEKSFTNAFHPSCYIQTAHL